MACVRLGARSGMGRASFWGLCVFSRRVEGAEVLSIEGDAGVEAGVEFRGGESGGDDDAGFRDSGGGGYFAAGAELGSIVLQDVYFHLVPGDEREAFPVLF